MNKKYPAYVVDAYIKSLGRDEFCYFDELQEYALVHYRLPYEKSGSESSFSEWVAQNHPDERPRFFAAETVGTTIFNQDYRYPEIVFDGYIDELERTGLDWSDIGLVNYGITLGWGIEFGNYYLKSSHTPSTYWYLYRGLLTPKPKFSERLRIKYPFTYQGVINDRTPPSQAFSDTEFSELQGVLKVGDVIRAVPGTDTNWLEGEQVVERIDGDFFWLAGNSRRYYFGGEGQVEIINNKSKTMSNDKFYKVTKDTFLWKAGAIIKSTNGSYYKAINSVWDVKLDSNPSLEPSVVENSPEWFERVF